MTRNKIVYCFLILFSCSIGCQTTGDQGKLPKPPTSDEGAVGPSGEIPLRLEAEGASGLMRVLKERAEKIQSFQASIVLSVSGQDVPTYEKLPGVLVASGPGRYRVTGYSASKKPVFDFLTLPDTTFLRWAPPGDEQLSMEAKIGRRPSPELMANLSLVTGVSPFPEPGIALANRDDEELMLYLLEQLGNEGILTRKRRIWLRGSEVLVTRIQELGSMGLVGGVDLDDYRRVDSHWIPHRLSFSIKDFFAMEILLTGISLNAPLPDTLFDPITAPPQN